MMLKHKLSIFFLLTALLASTAGFAIETKAQYAYMINAATGTVLLSKDADTKMHPSSMSKLMTVYVLFSRLKDGRMKLTDTLRVSEKAWRMQGSKMFVHVNDSVAVEDLLRGIVIQSGNDACLVVAEGISGTEEAFAQEMNRVAAEIGLKNSHFVNATGWPDEGQMMTARDLAILSQRIINDFPEYYHYFSEKEFTYNNIRQQNRDRLLGNDIGVDGLKTGHTEIAGYGITLSAKHPDGRRLILVVNGLASDNERVEEGDKLLRYGFREFTDKKLASAGDVIDQVPVWMGESATVPVTVEKDLVLTLPANTAKDTTFAVKYNGPVPTPIAKGTQVATLVVTPAGQEAMTVPLVASEDAPKLSAIKSLIPKLKYQLLGAKTAPAQ